MILGRTPGIVHFAGPSVLVSGSSLLTVFEIADRNENTLQNNCKDLHPFVDQKI